MSDIVWKILFFVAFFSCAFLVAWIDLPSETKLHVECWIREYSGTIISLGTLFFILLVGLLTTILTNYYAERRETLNRKISAALALSQFRQEWINSLRDDISNFSGKVATDITPVDVLPGGMTLDETTLATKILLRMNPKDKDYKNLQDGLKLASEARQVSGDRDLKPIADLRAIAQGILKREWERLKNDLEEAQVSLEEGP